MGEFFQLAGTWLDCRWHAIHVGPEDWHLLGCVDYAAEMRLVIQELRKIA